METTQQAMAEAGFFLESFLDCWMKHDGDVEITISNGKSVNGVAFEVQVSKDGQYIDGSEGDQTVESAIAFASRFAKAAA